MRVYFDASQKPPDLQFVAFGLLFVAIGAALLAFRNSRLMAKFWRGPKAWRTAFGVFFFGFSCLWTLISGAGIIGAWAATQRAERSGTMKAVEGPVENFHPMPPTYHDLESFTVDGVRFSYSDYVVTSGFNQSTANGGPIGAGMYVRIHYIASGPDGPTIVRLEIPCAGAAG